jgi:hypothetical protein
LRAASVRSPASGQHEKVRGSDGDGCGDSVEAAFVEDSPPLCDEWQE